MSSSFSYIGFSFNNLEGRIPDALGNFISLSHLDLCHNNLRGSIPHALGNLTSLSYLDLSSNFLEGRIPDFQGNLMPLSYLDISNNQLEGKFPKPAKNLSSLRFLSLSSNKLNGELPNLMTWLWDSTRLEYLDLGWNNLCGSLPDMSRFSLLKDMFLEDNQLNGSIIEDHLRLPNLKSLFLGSNRLEGLITEAHFSCLSQLRVLDLSFNLNLTIRISHSWKHSFTNLWLAHCELGPYFPKWLQKQNQVEILDISDCGIFDAIPNWFWNNIHKCEHLNMSHNHISGVLPDLSKSKLVTLDLSFNDFTGSLPLLPPVLYNIDLSRNKFSGTILNFCDYRNSYLVLDLSYNLLSSEIPQDCFMNLLSLAYLNLANNNFSGEIPHSTDSGCSVSSLHLRNNSFRGEIPRSLRNCSNLNILDLGDNEFTGKIPDWLGESMPELGVLSLKSNMLHGNLPAGLCHLAKLQVLDISMNKIIGTIPRCMNNFTLLISESESHLLDSRFQIVRNGSNIFSDGASVIWKGKEEEYANTLRLLKVIDLSSNDLTGEIPHEITSLIGLLGLNLSSNNLVGSIPHDIGQLKLLNFLDLSENNLSGGIPPTLSQMSHLGVLNLSFNDLSGKIPWAAHLQTFDAPTYLGNPRLCGPPLLSRPCPEDEKPTKGPDDLEDEDKFITRGFYVSMVLGFIVAFAGVFWTLFLNKWWNITIVKMFICVEDWLYVKVLVNKRRLMRYFGKE